MAEVRSLFVSLVLVAAGVCLWAIQPAMSTSAAKPDGRSIFVESRCQNCHTVSSAGLEAKTKSERLKGPDLVNVGQRHTADWIVKYLHQETELNDKKHRLKFKGSDEELQALIDWLLEQKAE